MIAYYAHPIDQSVKNYFADTIQAVAIKIMDILINEHQVTIYNPAGAWKTCAPPVSHMQEANLAVLDQADFLVATLPAGVPTIGVVLEISHAIISEIPVIIFSDLAEQSWALSWLAEQDGVTLVPFDQQRHVTSGEQLLSQILDTKRRIDRVSIDQVVAQAGKFNIDLTKSTDPFDN